MNIPTKIYENLTAPERIRAAVSATAGGPSRAPGMLAAHYAPAARVELVTTETLPDLAREYKRSGARIGLLAPPEVTSPTAVVRMAGPVPFDGEHVARDLYRLMRNADALQLDVLLVISPSGDDQLFAAVHDRLQRAAAGSRTRAGSPTSAGSRDVNLKARRQFASGTISVTGFNAASSVVKSRESGLG